MSESIRERKLGQAIAKTLGLAPGDDVELQRDKLNPDRIMILRYPKRQM
ncbi:MAG: hypothetical protein ACHQ03_04685 [Candidatus Bathyarchaeia archaeon]